MPQPRQTEQIVTRNKTGTPRKLTSQYLDLLHLNLTLFKDDPRSDNLQTLRQEVLSIVENWLSKYKVTDEENSLVQELEDAFKHAQGGLNTRVE